MTHPLEQLYDREAEAQWHWRQVQIGMIQAGVSDGMIGTWPSLWFEIRFEAENQIRRVNAEIKEAQRRMVL